MKQSIGAWATLVIIIIFIVIVFGLLAATISYYKAFKVNSMILSSIDKFEGYNDLAIKDIAKNLDTIGYKKGSARCNSRRGNASLVKNQDTNYYYCIYYYDADGIASDPKGASTYYNYSVVTYMFVELPLVNHFQIPVHTKGERIYSFSSKK